MKRTDVQKRIIPRNWLFGRLSYIGNNLRSIVKGNELCLTDDEISKLRKAHILIKEVISGKEDSSEELKLKIQDENI